jgi:hypothetical protein
MGAEFGGPTDPAARRGVGWHVGRWLAARRGTDGAVRVGRFTWSPLYAVHGARRRRHDQPPGIGPAGTPRRPNRPTTTGPSRCAGSSSPPDFAVRALSRSPRTNPGPFPQPGLPLLQPGLPPEHDQQRLRNTRGSASTGLGWLICEYENPRPETADRPRWPSYGSRQGFG